VKNEFGPVGNMEKEISHVEMLRQLVSVVNLRHKFMFISILFNALVMSVIEVGGIGIIFLFMKVVADPNQVQESEFLFYFYELFNFSNSENFLSAIGVAAFFVIVFRSVFGCFEAWFRLRFVSEVQLYFSTSLLKKYMHRNILFFYRNNTSSLAKNVLEEVNRFVGGYIMEVLSIASDFCVSIVVLLFLVLNEPVLSISAVLIIGFSYLTIYLFLKRKAECIGRERMVANDQRFINVNEAFGGIKEAKLLSIEHFFINKFNQNSKLFYDATVKVKIFQVMPRFLLEVISFGGIVLFITVMIVLGEPLAGLMGSLTLFGLGLYRAFPRLDGVLKGFLSLSFDKNVVLLVLESFESRADDWGDADPSGVALPFNEQISLVNVSFRYPGASQDAVAVPSLCIKHGSSVGIVGKTGAGKSTLMDLITGLLTPTKGELRIDDEVVAQENVRAWQRNIGYVPQAIFLKDGSVSGNIAYGVSDDKIDLEAVIKAAKAAHIHDFIINELPQGYETEVGERGVRLSGGQRQRIGIARALYLKPKVLVLDEATSALDNVTDAAVNAAIKELSGKVTIIMIAHRLSSVRDCDQIFLVDHGVVAGSGNYTDLLEKESKFRELAQADSRG